MASRLVKATVAGTPRLLDLIGGGYTIRTAPDPDPGPDPTPDPPTGTLTPATSWFYGPTNGFNYADTSTVLQRTYRNEHLAFVSGTGVRLRYMNAGPDPIFVSASVEPTLGGTPIVVTWGGLAEVQIAPHDVSPESDMVPGLTLTSGSKLATRSAGRVAVAGQKLMLGAHNFGGPNKGGVADGDLRLSGTITSAGVWLFGPSSIFVETPTSAKPKNLAVIGDSIGNTWPTNAFEGVLPAVYLSRDGESALNWVTTNPERRAEALAALEHFDTAYEAYGTNDRVASGGTYTAQQIRRNRLSIWKDLASRVGRVVVATQVPRTSTTDSGATVENQTPVVGEANRVENNTWIRAGAPLDPVTLLDVPVGTAGALVIGDPTHPVDAYFDLADVCEPARNDGRWKANYATDGIHPNAGTGRPAIAAAFPMSLIGEAA